MGFKSKKYKVSVLGTGAWGVSLASYLHRQGHQISLWGRNSQKVSAIKDSGYVEGLFNNSKIEFSDSATSDLEKAVKGSDFVLISISSSGIRSLLLDLENLLSGQIIVNTSKGLLPSKSGSFVSVSNAVGEILGERQKNLYSVLSGPSFAHEVFEGKHTAVSIASYDKEVLSKTCDLFHSNEFRVYGSSDVVGVEFGGIVKNVIALACGLAEGVGVGENAIAALITRGLAELSRLAKALGGRSETTMGLSGLGDLTLSCNGLSSRNKRFGYLLGKGSTTKEAYESIGQVVEGVSSCQAICELADTFSIDVPISKAVLDVLEQRKSVRESINDLMSRKRKNEI